MRARYNYKSNNAYFKRLSWTFFHFWERREKISNFVESLLWPLVDQGKRPIIVVVIKLLSDESLLVFGLRVGRGGALLVGLLGHLHCDLDADLPEVLQRGIESANLQVALPHHLGKTLGSGEEDLVRDVVDTSADNAKADPGEDVGIVTLARLIAPTKSFK